MSSYADMVHAIGWFDGRFGYNVHARGFFSALSRRVPTTISSLSGLQGPYLDDRRALVKVFPNASIASVALMYANLAAEPLQGAPGPRIIYTVWESTRLPDDWRIALAGCDQMWTPSTWGAAVIARNGLDPARVHVVPEGVDPVLFHPAVPPTDALSARKGFKFLHVGRYEERKGTRDLLRAFDRTFGPGEEVTLVLACDNPHEPNFDIVRELKDLDLAYPERLLIIPPVARHDVFAGLYTACDALVAPSRAEGWGLPICEAMACGLPVIATGYSAPTDYLGSESYRIDHRLVPVRVPFFEPKDGDLGFWAEPDRDHLGVLMREVFEDQETARSRGLAASERILERFTWDHAADAAITALGELF